MKKSILTIALAVMMLFAFVACEPSSMTIKQESDKPSVAVMATLADPDYYAGSTDLAAGKIVSATVTKEDGSTVSVMGTLTLAKVVAGENVATFAYGPTGSQTTVNAIVNGIGVKAVQLDTTEVKTSYTMEEIETLSPSSAEDFVTGIDVTYVWEDDTTAATITDVSTTYDYKKLAEGETFNGTFTIVATPTGTGIVVDKPQTAEFTVTISDYKPEPAPEANAWILFVGDEKDIPEVGEVVEESTTVDLDVDFNDSLSVATDKIHVLAVVAEGESASKTYKLVEEVASTKYTIHGLPASKFNEMSGDPATLVDSYDYEIAPNDYVPGVDISDALAAGGTVTVNDPLNVNSVSVAWDKESKYVPSLSSATTLPTETDFVITAKTASGVDVSEEVGLEVVFPSKIYNKVGEYPTFTVMLTYDSEEIRPEGYNVKCGAKVTE